MVIHSHNSEKHLKTQTFCGLPCNSDHSPGLCFHQVDAFLTPEEMFKGDITETLPLLKVAEKVMSSFLMSFNVVSEKIPTMFPPGVSIRKWDFSPDIIFSRFVKVHERLKVAYVSKDKTLCFKLDVPV